MTKARELEDVHCHLPLVLSAARSLLKSEDLAWDATQEALIALWKRAEPPENLEAWLLRTVRHRSLQLLRSQRRCERHERLACRECIGMVQNVGERIENSEACREVYQALDSLPPDQKQVFILREVEGLNYKDIAARLEAPMGTVRSRLSRARRALHALLTNRLPSRRPPARLRSAIPGLAVLLFAAAPRAEECEPVELAPAGSGSSRLGTSVAYDGSRVLLGAPGDTVHAPGSGAARVFSADTWREEERLYPRIGSAGDVFGSAVALAGDLAAVGAPGDDDLGANAGAAYIFRRKAGGWEEEVKLTAEDAGPGAELGSAVAASADRVLVGARFDRGDRRGAAYVFRLEGGAWREEARLAPDMEPDSLFGTAVALDADTAAVGAPGAGRSGVVFLFRFEADRWTAPMEREHSLLTPGAGLGTAVSLDGESIAAGAPRDGNQGVGAGAVVAFSGPEVRLIFPAPGPGQALGASVAASEGRIVAGAPGYEGIADYQGAVHVFARGEGGWALEEHFVLPRAKAIDELGNALAARAGTVLAGARFRDIGGRDTGAAYVFPAGFHDCNQNGAADACDLEGGASADADGDGRPDECMEFRRGDADGDLRAELTDAVIILSGLFLGGDLPCEDAADVDDDGALRLTDAVQLLVHLFLSGPPPAPPGLAGCGRDPTADALYPCSRACAH
jgi:RNA polymerase sigma factor (sigma-70 family)